MNLYNYTQHIIMHKKKKKKINVSCCNLTQFKIKLSLQKQKKNYRVSTQVPVTQVLETGPYAVIVIGGRNTNEEFFPYFGPKALKKTAKILVWLLWIVC